MTTRRNYSYLDSGAPVIASDSTSRIDLALHAILVTGYGSRPPAGWTREYSATGKAVFRNSLAAGGTGHRFRILDDGSAAAGYRVAMMRGYVNMSDVDTGIGADVMPSASDYPAGGGEILRSNVLSATPLPWFAWADELTCYMWISGSGTWQFGLHGFGDFASEVPGDAYRSFVLHQSQSWSTGASNSRIHGGCQAAFATPIFSQSRGISVMRGYSGALAGSVYAAPVAVGANPGNYAAGASGGVNAPIASALTPGSAQRYFAPMMISAEGMIRGRLRGLYTCLNDLRSVANGTLEYSAAGLPSGSVLQLMHCSSGVNTGGEGVVAVETGLNW